MPTASSRAQSAASDLELVRAVRSALSAVKGVTEVKMFGGIGFMLNRNLLVGASKRGLLLRVGKDRQSQALAQPVSTHSIICSAEGSITSRNLYQGKARRTSAEKWNTTRSEISRENGGGNICGPQVLFLRWQPICVWRMLQKELGPSSFRLL